MRKIVTYWEEDQQKIVDLKSEFRYRWTDHIIWTRNAMISIMNDFADAKDLSKRLLQNQDDIGELFRPYYDPMDVDKLVSLLKEHIAAAARIFEVPHHHVKEEEIWRANGKDIVTLLSTMNPTHWPTDKLDPMWTMHLDETIKQMDARVNNDWPGDISAFDSNHKHIIELADVLADGIVGQAITKFSRPLVLSTEV